MIPEVANYLQRIEDLREQVKDLIVDLPAEVLNWYPFEDSSNDRSNSLGVLAVHIIGAEQFWVHEVVGGHPPRRNRDQEFETWVDDPQEVLAKFTAVGEKTRKVLSKLTRSNLDENRQVRGKAVTVRWGILHVIDHTALHLGHMQITYQIWNKGKGINSPRWFKRI